MATTIWMLRRVEPANGKLGFVTIADDDVAAELVKKDHAERLNRGGRYRAPDTSPMGGKSGKAKAKKETADKADQLPLDDAEKPAPAQKPDPAPKPEPAPDPEPAKEPAKPEAKGKGDK